MTNTTLSIAGGAVIILGGMYVFLNNDQLKEADEESVFEAPMQQNFDAEMNSEVNQSGSWGDKNDDGSPIVYQKNKVLNYGSFTVHYDVWFNYAKVSGSGVNEVLRQTTILEGTKYASKDRSVQFVNVNGVGSLIVDGEVVASGELQNREEIKAIGPTSCSAVTDQVIEGCQ